MVRQSDIGDDFDAETELIGIEAEGITCWGQFVRHALLSIGACPHLQEITGCLRNCERKLALLGITAPDSFHLAFCQWTTSTETLSGSLSQALRAMLGSDSHRKEKVSIQE